MTKSTILLWGLLLLGVACSRTETAETAVSEETESGTMNTYYIGTYTNGESEGIYRVEFDPETAEFSDVKLAAETPNPSYLAMGPDGHVYAVNEDLQQEGVTDAGVSAWLPGKDGTLTQTNNTSAEGSYACYISVGANGRFALIANYGGGSLLSVPLDSAGIFGGSTQLTQHEGKGPNEARQEGPHAHSIVIAPDGNYVLAADLGIDKVMIYRVDEQGVLLPSDPAFVESAPGAGPRHIAFHPNGAIAYVVNELNGTIDVYDYSEGKLAHKQTISTLPDDFDDVNYCADIHVHPSGKFLYASNRGHGSIASYTVGADGSLTSTGHFTQDVQWPRHFKITDNGKYILIANERGDDIIIGELDPASGAIADTGKRIEVPAPVSIIKYQ